MPTTRPLTTLHDGKRGRPQRVRSKVVTLIGAAGLAALEREDLHVVPGKILRELALVIGEPAPKEPETKFPVAPDEVNTAQAS